MDIDFPPEFPFVGDVLTGMMDRGVDAPPHDEGQLRKQIGVGRSLS
jgi:hypothetical protein